jgi:putative tryptophan/tyrosine transport system substrate-binding protein
MIRRIVIYLLATALLSVSITEAQQTTKKVSLIGFLGGGSRSSYSSRLEAFREGLQGFGYIDGKNIIIEYRYAEGNLDRLPDLAAELVHLKVDLIVASGDPSVLAAKQATKTIPVVFVATSDPVADGFVTSLARPGGNATGTSNLYPELSAKRLELLKETLPKISRLAILFASLAAAYVKEQELAAQVLGIQLVLLPPLRGLDDIDVALATVKKEGAHALLVNPSPIVNAARERIVDFATKSRLPVMYAGPEFVDGGGLCTTGQAIAKCIGAPPSMWTRS